jgi:hypothetical protein
MFVLYNKLRAFCFNGAVALFLAAGCFGGLYFYFWDGNFLVLRFICLLLSFFLASAAGYFNYKLRKNGLNSYTENTEVTEVIDGR